MAKNIGISQGKLSKDQIEKLSKLTPRQSRLGDIKGDIKSGIINPVLLAKAVMNPKNVKFSQLSKTNTYVARIQFENGLVKEYELYSVIDVMQTYIKLNILAPLSNFRLAYLQRYDPSYKLPDDANVDEIERGIENVNQVIDSATNDKIEYDGKEIKDEQERENIRKETTERLITEAFMSAFLFVNSYGKTFELSQAEPKITRYIDGILDLCVQIAKECNWVNEEMGATCLSMIFRKESTDFGVISEAFGMKPLTEDRKSTRLNSSH